MITIKQLMLMRALKVAGGSAWATVKGIIAHFVDGTASPLRSLIADIDPVQDLHGQSSPYPPGGGVNMADQSALIHTGVVNDNGSVQEQSTRLFTDKIAVLPSTAYYYAVTGKSSRNEEIYINRIIEFDANGDFLRRILVASTESTKTVKTTSNDAYYISIDLRTSALTTNLTASDVTQLMMAKSSTEVPYSPYSNICPITGHTGVNVYVRGGNVWDEEWEVGSIFSASGENANTGTGIRSKNHIPCLPNTTYYFHGNGASSSNLVLFYYDENKTYLGYANQNHDGGFTTDAKAHYFRFRTVPDYGTTYNDNFSFNYPSTDTTYHAYTGQDYEVQFPALGKNIIPPNYSSATVNGVTFTVKGDGTIVANGLASADADFMIISASNIDSLLTSGQSYTFSGCPSGGGADKYMTRFNVMGKTDYGSGDTFTYNGGTPGNFTIRIKSGYNAQNLVFKPMVCLSSAPNPTVFEPYNTVYSGTLDVVTGELVVTEKVVDLGTLDWSKNNNGSFYANIDAKKDGVNPMMCENYGYVANKGYGVTNGTVSDSNSVAKRIFIRDDNYSDKDTFKTAMSGVQLLYPLATPITYQLTPTEVDSLLGVNNIWCDTGQVEVTYKKA